MKRSPLIRISALVVAVMLAAASFAACSPAETGSSSVPEEATVISVAALKGPTGMGFAGIFESIAADEMFDDISLELYGAPTDVSALLIGGKADIAAVPANLAATLYKKTEGKIKVVAVNTLSVLYVLEKGDTVHSAADLAGKTVVTSGQGSTPEYALNYILEKNSISDCTVSWLTEHAEVVAQAAAGNADIVLLPEPFVSVLLSKDIGYRVAVDINSEWEKVSDAVLSMGVLVAATDFIDSHPAALSRFIAAYSDSVKYVNENPASAAKTIAEKGIVASEALAISAIPNCNIVCITGNEMKEKLSPFLDVLFAASPVSVGGVLPDEAFYYTGA